MTRIVVTGAAGFIGSNIVRGLNARGIDDIVAVDDLTQGGKFINLADARIADYVDASTFYEDFERSRFGKIDVVFHQGACSDTMEADGRYMMRNNYSVSRSLTAACAKQDTRLIYASSAATYGGSDTFAEDTGSERALNVYGWSKLLFDQVARREFGADFDRAPMQLVGLRYFNVYGPHEGHKGRMASVAFHQYQQFRQEGKVRLFGAYGGYAAGEQRRDFVHVDDVVAVNLWFFDNPDRRGIFNLGTGCATPFNTVALSVVQALVGPDAPTDVAAAVQRGLIEYVDFPDALRGKYQCRTEADLSKLRAAKCQTQFADVATGVKRYMAWLDQQRTMK